MRRYKRKENYLKPIIKKQINREYEEKEEKMGRKARKNLSNHIKQ